ncbi:terminal nucleotidyltransferase 4B [Pelomyxa schiedti]|nr:terminal nucleotidyltransferase 4B [Pelomyxa schiedti]
MSRHNNTRHGAAHNQAAPSLSVASTVTSPSPQAAAPSPSSRPQPTGGSRRVTTASSSNSSNCTSTTASSGSAASAAAAADDDSAHVANWFSRLSAQGRVDALTTADPMACQAVVRMRDIETKALHQPLVLPPSLLAPPPNPPPSSSSASPNGHVGDVNATAATAAAAAIACLSLAEFRQNVLRGKVVPVENCGRSAFGGRCVVRQWYNPVFFFGVTFNSDGVDFCNTRCPSMRSHPLSWSSSAIYDEQLLSGVCLGKHGPLENITVKQSIVENPENFIKMMKSISRGGFLSSPCRMQFNSDRQWVCQDPEWWTGGQYHTLPQFIAFLLEKSLWSYYWFHSGEVRMDSAAKRSPIPNPTVNPPLPSSEIYQFWQNISDRQRSCTIAKIAPFLQHLVASVPQKYLEYHDLLELLQDLPSFSHFLLHSDERVFIDNLFSSPLYRAGSHSDKLILQMGNIIRQSLTDKTTQENNTLSPGDHQKKKKKQKSPSQSPKSKRRECENEVQKLLSRQGFEKRPDVTTTPSATPTETAAILPTAPIPTKTTQKKPARQIVEPPTAAALDLASSKPLHMLTTKSHPPSPIDTLDLVTPPPPLKQTPPPKPARPNQKGMADALDLAREKRTNKPVPPQKPQAQEETLLSKRTRSNSLTQLKEGKGKSQGWHSNSTPTTPPSSPTITAVSHINSPPLPAKSAVNKVTSPLLSPSTIPSSVVPSAKSVDNSKSQRRAHTDPSVPIHSRPRSSSMNREDRPAPLQNKLSAHLDLATTTQVHKNRKGKPVPPATPVATTTSIPSAPPAEESRKKPTEESTEDVVKLPHNGSPEVHPPQNQNSTKTQQAQNQQRTIKSTPSLKTQNPESSSLRSSPTQLPSQPHNSGLQPVQQPQRQKVIHPASPPSPIPSQLPPAKKAIKSQAPQVTHIYNVNSEVLVSPVHSTPVPGIAGPTNSGISPEPSPSLQHQLPGPPEIKLVTPPSPTQAQPELHPNTSPRNTPTFLPQYKYQTASPTLSTTPSGYRQSLDLATSHTQPPHPIRTSTFSLDLASEFTPAVSVSRPPWVRRPYTHSNQIVNLSAEIEDYVDLITARQQTQLASSTIVLNQIVSIVLFLWPLAQVSPFGSCVTSLAIPSSDLDIAIVLNGAVENQKVALQILADMLRKQDWALHVKAIDTASMPIIKLEVLPEMTRTDITFDEVSATTKHRGLVFTQVIQQYVRELPHFRSILLVLKQFLHERGLNNIYSGGLSSYLLGIMVITYLQIENPRNVCHSTGTLLLRFLRYYGFVFNYKTMGITMRNGGKHYKFGEGDYYSTPGHMIVIEDPFNPRVNVASGVFAMWRVQSAFASAYTLLRNDHTVEDVQCPSILSKILGLDPLLGE